MYLYVFKFNNHLTTVWHSTKTESKSLVFNKQVTRYFALPRQVTVSSTFIFKVWKHQLQFQNITVNWIILPVLIFKRLRYKIILSTGSVFLEDQNPAMFAISSLLRARILKKYKWRTMSEKFFFLNIILYFDCLDLPQKRRGLQGFDLVGPPRVL